MKRNLPQNNPSASWHHISHRKFCESEILGRERPTSFHRLSNRGGGGGEVSARLSPPAYFSQVYSDRKFSLDPTDRDTALNSLRFERSSCELCHPFRDPSRSDSEWHIGIKR